MSEDVLFCLQNKKKKLDGNPVPFQFHIYGSSFGFAKIRRFWFLGIQLPPIADCTTNVLFIIMLVMRCVNMSAVVLPWTFFVVIADPCCEKMQSASGDGWSSETVWVATWSG